MYKVDIIALALKQNITALLVSNAAQLAQLHVSALWLTLFKGYNNSVQKRKRQEPSDVI